MNVILIDTHITHFLISLLEQSYVIYDEANFPNSILVGLTSTWKQQWWWKYRAAKQRKW